MCNELIEQISNPEFDILGKLRGIRKEVNHYNEITKSIKATDFISSVDGPTGSGKTYAIIQYCKMYQSKGPIIIAEPTTIMCDQVYNDIVNAGIQKVVNVHSKNNHSEDSVYTKVISALESNKSIVVVCTHDTAFKLRHFSGKKSTTLFVDETPRLDKSYELYLPYNYNFLFDNILKTEEINPEILRLVLNKDGESKLSRIHDSVDDVIKPILMDIKSGREVYITRKQFNNIKKLKQLDSINTDDMDNIQLEEHHKTIIGLKNSKSRVFILSLCTPYSIGIEGYKEVIFLGSLVRDSMLFKYWNRKYPNIHISTNSAIEASLRYTEYQNGDRLEIINLYDIPTWSKYRLDNIEGGIEAVHKKALEHIGNNKFIYSVNNDATDSVLDSTLNGKRIPVDARGLNSYSDYHYVYLSPALNRSPELSNMLNLLGLDNNIQKLDSMYTVYEQLLGRSSLRDPSCTDKVVLIVPDLGSKEYIASRYKNSTSVSAESGEVKVAINVHKKSAARRKAETYYKSKVEQFVKEGKIRIVEDSFDDDSFIIDTFKSVISSSDSNLTIDQIFNLLLESYPSNELISDYIKFVEKEGEDEVSQKRGANLPDFIEFSQKRGVILPDCLNIEAIQQNSVDLELITAAIFAVFSNKPIGLTAKNAASPAVTNNLSVVPSFYTDLLCSAAESNYDNPKLIPITSISSLVAFLKLTHGINILDSKNNNNPVIFAAKFKDYEKGKTKDNVDYLNYVVFDFDGTTAGTVTPKKFNEIFDNNDKLIDIKLPTKSGKKCSYVMYNSFSHDPDNNINKFRVIMFVDRKIDYQEYSSFYKWMVSILDEYGYSSNPNDDNYSGLDHTSANPVQGYFLPCVNSNRPEVSFFESHNAGGTKCSSKEIERCVLQTSEIAKTFIKDHYEFDDVEYSVVTPGNMEAITPENIDTVIKAKESLSANYDSKEAQELLDKCDSMFINPNTYSIEQLSRKKAQYDRLSDKKDQYISDPTLKGQHDKTLYNLVVDAYYVYKGDIDKVLEIATSTLDCQYTDRKDRESQILRIIKNLVERNQFKYHKGQSVGYVMNNIVKTSIISNGYNIPYQSLRSITN